MFGVILLPILLSVSLSFQPAAGIECENTCATCYHELAKRLIDTGNNKYNLFRGFFPPHAAPPVVVKVMYSFINCTNSCANQTWYWTEGTFYIYQPLEVFVWRSLFFSPISVRQGAVELQLPAECIDAPSEFFELLTQKLKAYAMFQTATPRVDNTYVAKAVNGDKKLDYEGHDVFGYTQGIHLDRLLHAYQYMPFIVTFVIVIILPFLLCCLHFKCKSQSKRISQNIEHVTKDSNHQATVVAIVTLCSCFTVYNFSLDMVSIHADKNNDLPGYYNRNNGIFIYTITFALISLLFLIAGIVCFIALLCMWSYGPRCCCFKWCKSLIYVERKTFSNVNNEKLDDEERELAREETELATEEARETEELARKKKKWAIKKEKLTKKKKELAEETQHLALLIPMVLCVGSVVLSFSFHFQNILIAWSTDPLYASRIAVYYAIFIFVYYLTFKNTYMIPVVCKKEFLPLSTKSTTSSTAEEQQSEIEKDGCERWCIARIEKTWKCFKEADNDEKKERNKMRTTSCGTGLGILCVAFVGILLTGFHALNAVFIYFIPINHSIEESANGVQTIYNGAVLLIGALVAYNIGWFYYHSKMFSVKAALENAMEDLDEYPFGKDPIQDVEAGWGDLSAQDRMTKVMRGLLFHEAKRYKEEEEEEEEGEEEAR